MCQIIVAWSHHVAPSILVDIGSGNDFLPDATKPLPEPILTYHQMFFFGINLEAILQEELVKLIHNMCSEIKPLKLLPHIPRANELRRISVICSCRSSADG